MRRGGPYLSACAAGRQGSGERHRVGALFLLFALNIAPRERTTARRIERCCLSQCMTTKYGFVRPYVTTAPSTPLPLQELYSLLFRKKGSGSGLICYAAGSGAAARVCSVPFCWSYMAEKSCFPPSRQHFRFTTASSSALFTHLLPGELEARSLFKHFSC